jgi:hypothetical protein
VQGRTHVSEATTCDLRGLVLALTLKCKNGAGAEPPEDDKHHNSALGLKKGLLGTLGARWAFVDDMVSRGTTLTRVYGEIPRVCAHMQHHTEFVGVYQYIDKATGRAPTAGTTCSTGGASRAARPRPEGLPPPRPSM